MQNIRVARRYAAALFEIAHDRNTVQDVYRELQTAITRLESLPEVLAYIEQPFVATESKQRAIAVTFEGVVSDVVCDFLKLLVAKDRGDLLETICAEYRRLWLEHEGIVIAKVSSASELTQSEIAELGAALTKVTGKRVDVHASVTPELLGGVIVVIGDRVWDGSVRGGLELLRREMKAQNVVGSLRAGRG